MIVNNKSGRMYKVTVGLLSYNLPGRKTEKHEGPQDSWGPGPDSNRKPPNTR